jgi:hypothetical protein
MNYNEHGRKWSMALFEALPWHLSERAEINHVSQNIQSLTQDLNPETTRYKTLHEGSSLLDPGHADSKASFDVTDMQVVGWGSVLQSNWSPAWISPEDLAIMSVLSIHQRWDMTHHSSSRETGIRCGGIRFLQNIGTHLLWRHILEDRVILE